MKSEMLYEQSPNSVRFFHRIETLNSGYDGAVDMHCKKVKYAVKLQSARKDKKHQTRKTQSYPTRVSILPCPETVAR